MGLLERGSWPTDNLWSRYRTIPIHKFFKTFKLLSQPRIIQSLLLLLDNIIPVLSGTSPFFLQFLMIVIFRSRQDPMEHFYIFCLHLFLFVAALSRFESFEVVRIGWNELGDFDVARFGRRGFNFDQLVKEMTILATDLALVHYGLELIWYAYSIYFCAWKEKKWVAKVNPS